MMQAQIKDKAAFANVHLQLQPGDSVVAQADAMSRMSATIDMTTRMAGGFFTALARRFLGQESMFMNTFTTQTGGELVLTQRTPGDIDCVTLNGTSLYLQPGAFIACEPTVALGLGWAGLASFIGKEGLFRLKVSGEGRVWFGAYGGLVTQEINGELLVDTAHLVAYEPTLRVKMGLPGGLFSSFLGGEGLITRLQGQGRAYLQTRSIDGLAAWTNARLY